MIWTYFKSKQSTSMWKFNKFVCDEEENRKSGRHINQAARRRQKDSSIEQPVRINAIQ